MTSRDTPPEDGQRVGTVEQGSSERRTGPCTVLMIMYFFPPLGGVAVGRNLGHVVHLPRERWRPIVLTPADPAAEPRDAAAIHLMPRDVVVIRSRSIEAGHLRRWALRARRMAGRLSTQGRPHDDHPTDAGPDRAVDAVVRSPAPRRDTLGLTRVRRAVFFPDDQIGWLPFAVAAALRRHHGGGFDAVFSTSSPITAHVIAGVVKRLTGVPWVAEFRDPWVGNPIAAPSGRIHRWAQTRIEGWIVQSADRIVLVTPSLTRMYQERYPAIDRFETITNGYSRSERVPAASPPDPSTRFRLVHTGTLYRPSELRVFLEALGAVLARRPEFVDRLDVSFYGTVSDACARIAGDIVGSGRLSSVVSFEGFVSRSVALAAIANADAALLLLGGGRGMDLFVPGKTYEYLGQDRQILAMLPPGDAREVLESLGWGIVADPDPSSMAAAIERLLDTPRPARPADPNGAYDRATLGRQLADVLTVASSPVGRHRPAQAGSGTVDR